VDAPYIAEFPYALECEVAHILDLGLHTLFIGEVKGTVVEDGATAQWSDIISWDASTREYFAKGAPVAKAFSAGMRFVKTEPNQ
jgi:flavin reductase (DIM6/NTAB) family NADH-FMN oxidoreductase RutF